MEDGRKQLEHPDVQMVLQDLQPDSDKVWLHCWPHHCLEGRAPWWDWGNRLSWRAAQPLKGGSYNLKIVKVMKEGWPRFAFKAIKEVGPHQELTWDSGYRYRVLNTYITTVYCTVLYSILYCTEFFVLGVRQLRTSPGSSAPSVSLCL